MTSTELLQTILIKQRSILAACAKIQNLSEKDIEKAFTNEIDKSDVIRELTDVDNEIWSIADFLTLKES